MIWHPVSWITFHADYTLFYIGMILGFIFIFDIWRRLRRLELIFVIVRKKERVLEPERKKDNN